MSDLNWDAILEDETTDTSRDLPPNTYTARAVFAQGKVASTGTVGVAVKFAVIGGPYADVEQWANIWLTPNSKKNMSWSLDKLSALGVTREWIRQNSPSQDQIASVIDSTQPVADIEVIVGNYEGQDRPEVKNIKPSKGAVPPTPDGPRPPQPGASAAPSTGAVGMPPKPTLPPQDQAPF